MSAIRQVDGVRISPEWDDVRSYEELRDAALFSVERPGKRAGVFIVLKQDKWKERIEGVAISHDRYGIVVDSEFSAHFHNLEYQVGQQGASLTRDTSRAVRAFLERAGAF